MLLGAASLTSIFKKDEKIQRTPWHLDYIVLYFARQFKSTPLHTMKIKSLSVAICALLAVLSFASSANAQWGGWAPGFSPGWQGYGGPGWGWGPGYGMGYPYGYWNYPHPVSPFIGRVKIEGDVNYSTTIDGVDAALGNEAKRNPNGLIIGAGEMTKLLLTCEPNADRQSTVGEPKVRLPFPVLVASLELRGINLADKKGRFASFEEEVAACGHVLVWLDHTKRYLLLDSSDPARRRVEWPYASSVPPERVFVEGLSPTQPGSAFIVTMELDDSNRHGLCKIFGEPAIWDRQMISVQVPGVKPKPWSDKTPVWVTTGGAGK